MTLQRVDRRVAEILGRARAAAVDKRNRAEVLKASAAAHAARFERIQGEALAEYGALLWRAGRYWHENSFVRSMLRDFQSVGHLTPAQRDGLARTVRWLEHGGKGR